MEQAKDLKWEDIKVGTKDHIVRVISEKDIRDFAELSGDYNPLHTDKNYAASTEFGKQIVHGMFLGALCSQLMGMKLIGKNCLYLSQDLQFHKPAFIGDRIEVWGKVKHKSEATKIIDIFIEAKRGNEILMSGTAKVKVHRKIPTSDGYMLSS